MDTKPKYIVWLSRQMIQCGTWDEVIAHVNTYLATKPDVWDSKIDIEIGVCSVYDGMSQEDKDKAHAQQIQQKQQDGA